MNIMDLDEAEGLTAEMLVAYLVREGYAQTTYHTTTEHWQKRVGRILYQINVLKIERSVQLLATWAKVSPQSILREMNPRLRKGKPTDREIEAHVQRGGVWIAARGELGNGGTICFINFYWDTGVEDPGPFSIWDGQEWSDTDWDDGYDLAEWSFWPCDAHGSKIRWPSIAGEEGRR